MGTVYGVNRTKINSMSPENYIEQEEIGSKVRWVYDSYEAAALAGGSVIEVCQDLPAEARIVDWIIDHDALSGDCALSFGTSEDDNEFMDSTACTSADKKNFTDDGVAASLGFEIASGDGQTLIITTSGSSAATGTIKVAVAYTSKH